MTYWEGIILGVVQGISEFLPISSSGHLVVAESLLGFSTPGVVVEVVLHVATLLAIIVVYRGRLLEIFAGLVRSDRATWRTVGALGIATVPAAIVGLGFSGFFERAFESLLTVGVAFVVTGLLLWSTRLIGQAPSRTEPTMLGAVAIGLAQAFSILPGISRSGTTVTTAMWLGVDPVRAAEFSFLLAIPAIAGAAVLQIPDLGAGVQFIGAGPLVASFLTALVSGVAAIRLLISLLRSQAFHLFAPYLWTVGIATTLWASLG